VGNAGEAPLPRSATAALSRTAVETSTTTATPSCESRCACPACFTDQGCPAQVVLCTGAGCSVFLHVATAGG
jgi:hypothetical protein